LGSWRREARSGQGDTEPAFVPIRIIAEAGAARAPAVMERHENGGAAGGGLPERVGGGSPVGTIDIEIGRVRVRVSGAVDATALQQVLMHFGRRA
jgi:hypothetical protein